jgi:transposase-like protein
MDMQSTTPYTKVRRTRSQWQAIIAEFEQSTLGVQEFCQQHDLAYSSFAKWRSLLRQESKNSTSSVSFIEMPSLSPAQSRSNWTIELDLGTGVTLRLMQN